MHEHTHWKTLDTESRSPSEAPATPFSLMIHPETGERHTAFAMECTGAALPRAESKRAPAIRAENLLSAVLEELDQDDVIEFDYTGGGKSNFGWRVRGRCAEQQGTSSVGRVYSAVNAMLDCLSLRYRFTPVSSTVTLEDRGKSTGAVRVRPMVHVKSDDVLPLGFHQVIPGGGSQPVIRLPRVSTAWRATFGSLGAAVMSSPVPLLCRVRLRRLTLTPLQRQWLETIARIGAGGGSDDDTDRFVQAWLHQGAGVQLKCVVISGAPVPTAFLRVLGEELYRSPVEVVPVEGGPGRALALEPDHVLDLSICQPLATRFPVLFPSVESLREANVPQFHPLTVAEFGPQGLELGVVADGASESAVRIGREERSRHCYIAGATGTGKSTLLLRMIAQDIANGEGVAVMDPHGDLVQQVIRLVPAERLPDLVYWDFADPKRAPGLNVLDFDIDGDATRADWVVNDLLRLFERLYDMRHCGGPMFEIYFRNALLLLKGSGLEGPTLADLPAVFENSAFRNYLLKQCRFPWVVSFWRNQAERATGDTSLHNIGPYIVSKLNLFTYNLLVRRVVAQSRSTVDFRQIMDRRKLLLVNLAKGTLGELNTQFLGTLLLTQLFHASLSRAAVIPASRAKFFLYVDEFQNFVTDSAAHLLSEARKFGLCLTLANQNLSQLSANLGQANVLDAVLGNVGSLVLFRLGVRDAQLMQNYTEPYLRSVDLQNLPNFHAFARILTPAGPSRPVVFQTQNMRSMSSVARLPATLRCYARRYTRSLSEVEAAICARQERYHKLATPSRTDN